MIPLLFNLKNRKVLVVGGGKIATRRVMTLLNEGATVVCVSSEFSEELKEEDCGKLILKQKKYDCKDLEEMSLVVAATASSRINELVKRNCQSKGLLCNRVDHHEDSDFIFPSTIRRGDMTISVCTEGASPSLTKKIVRSLSNEYSEAYAEKVALLKALRKIVLDQKQIDPNTREKLNQLTDCSVLELKEKLEEYKRINTIGEEHENKSWNPGK